MHNLIYKCKCCISIIHSGIIHIRSIRTSVKHPFVLFLRHYCCGRLNTLVRPAVIDIRTHIAALDFADNGLMRLIYINPFDGNICRQFKLCEHLKEFTFRLVGNELPNDIAFLAHSKDNRAAVLV